MMMIDCIGNKECMYGKDGELYVLYVMYDLVVI